MPLVVALFEHYIGPSDRHDFRFDELAYKAYLDLEDDWLSYAFAAFSALRQTHRDPCLQGYQE